MLIHDLLSIVEASAKDPDKEGARQRSIKEILRKLNNGVINKKTADKQLRDKGHPGVDLAEDVENDRFKAAQKERLDKMEPKDLHAHIVKHAEETKLPGETASAADIKGHALRTAARLGHKDNSAYWNKIKHLVKEDEILDDDLDEVSEATEGKKSIKEIAREIGKKCGVDFEDADAKQAMKALIAAYKRGFADGKSGE